MSDFHCAKAVLKVMIGSGLGGRKKEFLPIYLLGGGVLFNSAYLILDGCRKFLAIWRLRPQSITNSTWKGWDSWDRMVSYTKKMKLLVPYWSPWVGWGLPKWWHLLAPVCICKGYDKIPHLSLRRVQVFLIWEVLCEYCWLSSCWFWKLTMLFHIWFSNFHV